MWIEIIVLFFNSIPLHVTPRAGVWIEISGSYDMTKLLVSLPVRECGLKFTDKPSFKAVITASLPVRECGLK